MYLSMLSLRADDLLVKVMCGSLANIEFQWQRKSQCKREFNMHGKAFVPSASLILAKAPESRAESSWKQGSILVQSWRMLSSHRNSVWQAEKLNCPRLPYKREEFGPHLSFPARLCLPCRNDPEVCNSRHPESCVLQREQFCHLWAILAHFHRCLLDLGEVCDLSSSKINYFSETIFTHMLETFVSKTKIWI